MDLQKKTKSFKANLAYFRQHLDLEIETIVTDFINIISQKPIFVTDL